MENAESVLVPRITARIQYRESKDSPLIDCGEVDVTDAILGGQN